MFCMEHSTDELLTTEEAAQILGVTRQSIGRYIRWGKLPAITKGGRWLVKVEDVERFAKEWKNDRQLS